VKEQSIDCPLIRGVAKCRTRNSTTDIATVEGITPPFLNGWAAGPRSCAHHSPLNCKASAT
jgi:hypothetical protein